MDAVIWGLIIFFVFIRPFIKGLKNKRDSHLGSKYDSHPEELDMIARKVAKVALESGMHYCYCKSCSVYLELTDSSGEIYSGYSGKKSSTYCFEWSSFGMEEVPTEDARLFLSAFRPYLQKHLEAGLKTTYTAAQSVSTVLTKYETTRYGDVIDVEDAIKIVFHYPTRKSSEPVDPKYKPW